MKVYSFILKRINFYYALLVSLSVFFSNPALAQTALCNGSLGDPVINIDFGRGAARHGPAIPESSLLFQPSGTPRDNWYTIAKSTEGMHPSTWHQIGNHTANDPDGYMMVVNASDDPGIFYEDLVSNLCANTTYEFAAWIINLHKVFGNKPNLTFTITTPQGSPLAEFNTGDIAEGTATDWLHPGFLFTTPANVTEILIRIRNNGFGGYGNDIAVDDITFSPCGATIIPAIDGASTQHKNLCVGDDKSFILSAQVSSGVYTNPDFLWQEKDANGIWQDMPREISNQFTKNFVNEQAGSYKYRLLVAESGNISSPNCRAKSPEFELLVNMPPATPLANPPLTICAGEPINLFVSNASSYKWTGPDGFTSDLQSPIIRNASPDKGGTYSVTVFNSSGCVANTQTSVTVIPRPVAFIDPISPICKGSSVTLTAHGGLSYRWLPAAGLSAPDIASPVVSPTKTTEYTVYVSNGYCETSARVRVVVIKELVASAGPDLKVIVGNSVVLNGSISGENIGRIFWTPSDYLDDPLKLNPIAKPPVSTTYTLNVMSDAGCSSSQNEVLVKVYEKLIVPNTFSPNGDSTNDLWNIPAIGAYPGANVKIVNRYGQLVFQSSGYEEPWNGKYLNQDVPVGVYYYMIDLNSQLPALSGSLTVIR